MAAKRFGMAALGLLGGVSFLCLVLYFLALTDIWHDQGRPDFWNANVPNAVEWRLLQVAFWPMLLFHLVLFGRGIRSALSRRAATD